MFFPNDVLEYAQPPGRAIRILWIDEHAQLAVIYELSRAHFGARGLPAPQTLPLQTLVDDARARRARLLLNDPYRATSGAALSDKQLRQQLRAWDAVRALHGHRRALYQQPRRIVPSSAPISTMAR
jgi:hypothetical protein